MCVCFQFPSVCVCVCVCSAGVLSFPLCVSVSACACVRACVFQACSVCLRFRTKLGPVPNKNHKTRCSKVKQNVFYLLILSFSSLNYTTRHATEQAVQPLIQHTIQQPIQHTIQQPIQHTIQQPIQHTIQHTDTCYAPDKQSVGELLNIYNVIKKQIRSGLN